jgi:hypothetical protein
LLAHKGILTSMLARGLSAAVVAEIVSTSGITNARLYPEIVVVIIAATVVISAIGVPLFARKPPARTSEPMGKGWTSDQP